MDLRSAALTADALSHRGKVEAFLEDSARAIDERIAHLPTPAFDFSIGWAKSYDDLFKGVFYSESDSQTVLSAAESTGRVLISARGGAGKTYLLLRLAATALNERKLPILLNLASWSNRESEDWTRLPNDSTARIEFLLRNFGRPKLTLAGLDALPAELEKIVFIDGLSEIRSGVGDQVLRACDDLVSQTLRCDLIAADRLVRREFRDETRWQLATLLPLSSEEIERQLTRRRIALPLSQSSQSLLEEPFFLDSCLREGAISSTGTLTLGREFNALAKLSKKEFLRTAKAALEAYAEFGARTFTLESFAARAGKDAVDKLMTAGLLRASEDRAYFAHQLHHDFLASVALATDPNLWKGDTFNAVSLWASSFDTIAMALEQLDRKVAESFLRKVYDWNPYAAAYAMAEGKRRATLQVSPEMEAMVLAMLAIRRWDVITASASRATDALSVFPSELAREFIKAPSLEDVLDIVKKRESDSNWFKAWQDTFTRRTGEATRDADVEAIKNEDSVMGWTIANVLKRLRLTPEQQRTIRSYLKLSDETVRWRIAHVLGGFPTRENAAALLALWDQSPPGTWVRYGATRSLVELAATATDPALQESVLVEITNRAEAFIADSRTLGELARAMTIRSEFVTAAWITALTPLLRTLFQYASDTDQQDEWRGIAGRLSAAVRVAAHA